MNQHIINAALLAIASLGLANPQPVKAYNQSWLNRLKASTEAMDAAIQRGDIQSICFYGRQGQALVAELLNARPSMINDASVQRTIAAGKKREQACIKAGF